LFILADDSVNGNEIWKTDLSMDHITKDINNGSSSSWLEKFHVDKVNNELLFFLPQVQILEHFGVVMEHQ
jgi:ELWxxDGT repeat protein